MKDKEKIKILNNEIKHMKKGLETAKRTIEYYEYMKEHLDCVEITHNSINFSEMS